MSVSEHWQPLLRDQQWLLEYHQGKEEQVQPEQWKLGVRLLNNKTSCSYLSISPESVQLRYSNLLGCGHQGWDLLDKLGHFI